MNKLSNLMINSERASYMHLSNLTKEEYKLLLFIVESQERYYNKYTTNHKKFIALKKVPIENHNMLNSNSEGETK